MVSGAGPWVRSTQRSSRQDEMASLHRAQQRGHAAGAVELVLVCAGTGTEQALCDSKEGDLTPGTFRTALAAEGSHVA